MTARPPLDRGLADRLLARGIASERRHRHLLELAQQHGVTLPALYVGDERAIDHALALLEQAGADINWDLIELPPTHQPPERRNQP